MAPSSDYGYEALFRRLGEQADEIFVLTKRLTAAKRRRDALVLKLVRGHFSERLIGAKAGVSGPRIQQLKRKPVAKEVRRMYFEARRRREVGLERARTVLAGGDNAIAAHLLGEPLEVIERVAGGHNSKTNQLEPQ